MTKTFKRYCKTLRLKDDPQLIEEYKKLHGMGNCWPEITQGMKDVGIIDMEIYLADTTLFMIMDTVDTFDHDEAMARLATLPRQGEWEATVSTYQRTSADASAREKWRLIERIFKMDQKAEYRPEEGYFEEVEME
jgi:L-rhamnose mutarotase